MVTVFSGVKEGYNENEVVDLVQQKMLAYELTETGMDFKSRGLEFQFTGKIKEQEKQMAFLSSALLIAVFLILLILVTQFNSFSTPLFGDTTFSEPYDMDFDVFGAGNTVDFSAGFGLQSFSDQGIRDAFLGSGSASLGLGANDIPSSINQGLA